MGLNSVQLLILLLIKALPFFLDPIRRGFPVPLPVKQILARQSDNKPNRREDTIVKDAQYEAGREITEYKG